MVDNLLGYIIVVIIIASFIYIYVNRSSYELKCIVSNANGNVFCVRDRERLQESAELLARVTDKTTALVAFLKEKYPDKECVKRLVKGYNAETIKETLPNSKHTAYTENKKDMSFCLNVKKNEENSQLIDEHTLTFVAIHEMSHIACKSIGHKTEFWETFRFFLQEAKEAGIHEPIDYSKQPVEYCSQKITDNPYFN